MTYWYTGSAFHQIPQSYLYTIRICVVYLLKEKWSSWFELRCVQELLTVNDYRESHIKVCVAHAARIVTHHLVYGQVPLAQRLFFADRGIDWYRVITRDWCIFCAILWFAFFFVHFVVFVHHHDVLKSRLKYQNLFGSAYPLFQLNISTI